MTELENPLSDPVADPDPEPTAGPSARKPGRLRRVVEWFWGGAAMRSLVSSVPHKTVHELERRALVSLELARLAIDQSFQHGSAEPMACELTRQATYWALLAEREVRTPRQGDLPGPRERPTFAELWPGANASVIALAAGGEAEADFLGSHVRETSLAAFADMDRAQCMRITLGLRRVARALLSEVDASDREIDRIWMRRILRIGGVLVLGAAVAIAATSTMNWLERRRDVAHGRPWTASSNFGSGGCQSPVQSCSDSPTFFFHTQEEANPSFTIDLESVQRVSGVHVVNRGDCCLERAVPLVVEVSLDQKVWQRVAQRTAEFSDWKATFRTIPARWVRLTVERRTMLHLQEVRVLR